MSNGWKIIKGSMPILLVAAHNYPHLRKNKIKPRDIGTGSLVKALCNDYGCWGMITTKVQADPNWYLSSSFREKIKEIINQYEIKMVIDIHGRKKDSPELIELYPNNAFRKTYSELLKDKVVNEFVNNEQITLAEDLDKIGLPSVEVEIRKDGRLPTNKQNYNYVYEKLSSFLR